MSDIFKRADLRSLIALPTPLPRSISDARANCFNAVQLYFRERTQPQFLGPVEFVSYLATKFRQLSMEEREVPGDVAVIWSRSSQTLPIGSINIESLNRRDEGYPFGLIIEHAFVVIDAQTVFQKRDPSDLGPFELLSSQEAREPYLQTQGFEVTRHRQLLRN